LLQKPGDILVFLMGEEEIRFTICSSARIIFDRGAVMAKALDTTVEEEHRMGLHK
jgi:hypothetical protein